MQALMALSLLSSFALAFTLRTPFRWYAIGGGVLATTSLLVTRLGNAPINGQIKTWSADSPPADYTTPLHRWDTIHNLRTGVAIAAFLLLIALVQLRSAGETR